MPRLIEIGWACGGALALKVTLLARNRVISSVSLQKNQDVLNRKNMWEIFKQYWVSFQKVVVDKIQVKI